MKKQPLMGISNAKFYIFDRMDEFTAGDLAAALRSVSPARREKALSFVFTIDRKLSVIAELLLRFALKENGFAETLPKICETERGKPYFSPPTAVYFNLSHCRLAVACAICASPVGVDVECIGECTPDLTDYVLNCRELAAVNGADAPNVEFCKYFTIKESLLKYTGEGLIDDIPGLLTRDLHVDFYTEVHSAGYVSTICLTEGTECGRPEKVTCERLRELF